MSRRPSRGLLSALFVLALALRCRGLGRSLWYDELVSLQGFAGSLSGVFTQQIQANNHPLASLLLWANPATSELWLHLPFAVLGALSCPALAWSLASWGRARSGVLAAALLAVSPPAVLLSQQARGYAGLMLCVALLPGLARRQRGAPIVALGVGFHASFVLALGWVGLRRSAAKSWALGLAVGVGVCGGAFARTWPYVRRALRDGDLGAQHALSLGDLWGWLSAGSLPWGVAFVAGVACGLLVLRGRERWLAAPLAGLVLLLAVGVPGYPRFASFALPCLCALAGRGLASLPLPRGAAALLIALAVPPLSLQADRPLQDLRGAAERVRAAEAQPYADGFAAGSVRHYLPDAHDDLAGFLADPGPAAFVDPFPELTPPEVRQALRDHAGEPQRLPGVHPVEVYLRGE